MRKIKVVLLKCHVELRVILLLNGRMVNRTLRRQIDGVLLWGRIPFNSKHDLLLLLAERLPLNLLRTDRSDSLARIDDIYKVICLQRSASDTLRPYHRLVLGRDEVLRL